MDKRVPEVRFKGFTDDWEQHNIKDISKKFIGGGTPKTSVKEYWTGDIPWLQSSDLFKDKLFGIQPRKFISDNAINNSAAKLIHKNSITLVTRVGVGKLALIPFDFATSQDFLTFVDLNIEPIFGTYLLYHFLENDSKKVQGTSIKGITKKYLLEKKVIIPSEKNEQNVIGQLMLALDNNIVLYQRQLKLYKKIKQSLLQTMFPKDGEKVPKVRFTDFHDDWEQHSLKEVMKNFIVPMRDKPKKFDGNIPWTRIEDIDGKYLNGSKSGRYVSNNTIKEMHLKIIPSNSIIVSASATFGVVAIVTQDLVTNQTFIGMVPNSNYTIDFLYSLFQSPVAQKKMKKESAGSTIFYIPRESFEKMKFNLPIISEQNKVGTILKKIDSLISKYEYQLILYKDIKKFNLQKLYI